MRQDSNNVVVKTLTNDAILRFAQSLHADIARFECISPNGNFEFRNRKDKLIVGIPWNPNQNSMGFRSFLGLKRQDSGFSYSVNGQAGRNATQLAFFGEQGPMLYFRDIAPSCEIPFSNFDKKGVSFGLESRVFEKIFSLPEGSKEYHKLGELDNAKQAIDYVVGLFDKDKLFPLSYDVRSVLASIISSERSSVPLAERKQLSFYVDHLLPHMDAEGIFSVLSMTTYKGAGAYKAMSEKGVLTPHKLAEITIGYKYPSEIAKMLSEANEPSDVIIDALRIACDGPKSNHRWEAWEERVMNQLNEQGQSMKLWL